MRRLLHEPLLHFLALGALLFLLYGWINGQDSGAPNQIVVDQARANALVGEFQSTWQRAPTAQELDALQEKWVREEILYREGVAEGFDRDDPVVRRRVVQKMDFLAESFASTAPTEAQLQAWLDAHAADYWIAPVISFEQAYFDPLKRGASLEQDMAAAKRVLSREPGAMVGDDIMLPSVVQKASTRDLAGRFGDKFAQALITLPVGTWAGPVQSGFGLHLVRVTARQDGHAPSLPQVRQHVERDLVNDNSLKASENFYEGLRKGYTIKRDYNASNLLPAKGADRRVAGDR